jgi:hypothetical protein
MAWLHLAVALGTWVAAAVALATTARRNTTRAAFPACSNSIGSVQKLCYAAAAATQCCCNCFCCLLLVLAAELSVSVPVHVWGTARCLALPILALWLRQLPCTILRDDVQCYQTTAPQSDREPFLTSFDMCRSCIHVHVLFVLYVLQDCPT